MALPKPTIYIDVHRCTKVQTSLHSGQWPEGGVLPTAVSTLLFAGSRDHRATTVLLRAQKRALFARSGYSEADHPIGESDLAGSKSRAAM